MTAEIIDVYRSSDDNDAGRPACFPEPSSRYPNIVFSYPQEWEVIASGLGALMKRLNDAASDQGHTLVILNCEQFSPAKWAVPLDAFKGEEKVSSKGSYYEIIEIFNAQQVIR